MSFRDDVDALAARHSTLEQEHARKTRELAAAATLLDEARARQRLPILENIHVAAPCPARWDAMQGDERVRHCGDCKKNVYNLSGMTRDEAEALLVAKNGNLCVRYYQRADGTILLADCTVGASKKRKRRLIAAGAAALLAGGVAARTLSRDHERDPDKWHAIAGGIGSIPASEVATLPPAPPPAPNNAVPPRTSHKAPPTDHVRVIVGHTSRPVAK